MFEIAVCDAYRGCKNPHLGALGIGVVAFEFLAFAAFTAIALEGSGQKFLGAGGFFAQMRPKLDEPAQCLVSLDSRILHRLSNDCPPQSLGQ